MTQRTSYIGTTAIAVAIAGLGGTPAWAQSEERREMVDQARSAARELLQAPDMQAERIIADWPDTSRKVARTMIEQYGQPDGVTPTLLVWNNNGPWNETVLSREPVEHNFPVPHEDVLAQSVFLEVPPDKFDDLAEYDGSVIVERTKGTITARCDKEEANYLALNLAHDIINDRRTVEEARRYYARAMQDLMESGEKEDRYLQGLQFQPVAAAQAGDPDRRFRQIAQADDY